MCCIVFDCTEVYCIKSVLCLVQDCIKSLSNSNLYGAILYCNVLFLIKLLNQNNQIYIIIVVVKVFIFMIVI